MGFGWKPAWNKSSDGTNVLLTSRINLMNEAGKKKKKKFSKKKM